MPVRIEQHPLGLIDVLRLKDRFPNQLLDNVQPTVETLRLYLATGARTGGNSTATLTAVGNTVEQEVPAGELWFLWNLNGQMVFDVVGQVGRVSIEFTKKGSSGGNTVAESETRTAVTVADAVVAHYNWEYPVVLESGDLIRARVREIDLNGAPSMVGSLRYVVTRVGPEATIVNI